VVVPVKAALAGDMAAVNDILVACKEACGTAPMKVILESGLFTEAGLLRRLSQTACSAGADFLKTSTGKVPQGASLEAAAVMLSVIADGNLGVGFKASGGIADNATAAQYLALADILIGPAWAGPATFRFGASRLLDALLADLGHGGASGPSSGY
jgi:deoxyribose-phosphate aldolase